MIKSFRDKDTQALFEGRCPRRWQAIRRGGREGQVLQ